MYCTGMDSILGQGIEQKAETPHSGPTWSEVTNLIRVHTGMNKSVFDLLPKLSEDQVVQLYNGSVASLKNLEGGSLANAAARSALKEYREGLKDFILAARRALERDVRTMISRSSTAKLSQQ